MKSSWGVHCEGVHCECTNPMVDELIWVVAYIKTGVRGPYNKLKGHCQVDQYYVGH